MTGRHVGLGWPGAIGDQARDATAPPYIGRHRDTWHDRCPRCRTCGQHRHAGLCDPRRCEDCGHLEDCCQCPHDCTYPEDTDD